MARAYSHSRDGCAGTELVAEQGAATLSGWAPEEELQRGAASNSVPARRVEVQGSPYCVALLVQGATLHCVARLVWQALYFNAIRWVNVNTP
jgi:hypothetical protein